MTTHSVPCILVVDDEEQIRSALHTVLSARSYEVVLGADGKEALDLARQHQPDLVVLDLAMPEMNGLQVCKQLRTWTAIPILVLSVRGSEADKILALDLGADDFLTKPFATGELLARIRALLRRAGAGQGAASDPVIRVGPLAIDTVKRRVLRDDVELRLTRTEFDILVCLAQHADRVATSRAIMDHVWGAESTSDQQTLRVHIGNLRKKIEPHPSVPRYILSEPGVGYRFSTL